MDQLLDPGYEEPVIRRNPVDVPGGPLSPGHSFAEEERLRRLRPTPMGEARRLAPQVPSQRVAERMANAITRNLNYGRPEAEAISQTIMGGERGALPLGLGLKDLFLAPGAFYLAADSGQRAGAALGEGDYGTVALETGLGLALPLGLTLRAARNTARAEDAIDRAMRANGVRPQPQFTQGYGGQRGALAGPRALTADLQELDRAKKAEAAGKPMDEIQKITGWRKDENNKWFFEISDKESKFDPTYALRKERGADMDAAEFWGNVSKLGEISLDNGEAVTYPNVAKVFAREVGRPPTAAELEKAAVTDLNEAYTRSREARNRVLEPITFRLGDIWQHPNFYSAYPKAADMPYEMASRDVANAGAHFDQSMGPVTGMGGVRTRENQFVPRDPNNPIIRSEYLDDLRSTAGHEVGGHAVQFMEGMDPGASYTGIMRQKNRNVENARAETELWQLADKAVFLRQRNPGMPDNLLISEMQRLGMGSNLLNRPGVGQWVAAASNDPTQVSNGLARSTRDLQNTINKYPHVDVGMAQDLYFRDIGETQARAVQARMGMSQEELRNTPFPSSYDNRSAGQRLFTEAELYDPYYVIDPATRLPRPNQNTPSSPFYSRQPPPVASTPYSMSSGPGGRQRGALDVGSTPERAVSSSASRFSPAAIKEAATPEHKGRYKLIDMPIDEFLSLAEKGVSPQKLEDARRLLKENTPYKSVPYLYFDDAGRIEGHEGRHRALALKEAGYTTIPVQLRSANLRWSEQLDPENFDYRQFPTRLRAQERAADPNYSVPFPVRREQAMRAYGAAETPPTAPETPEFRSWFADSKVADAAGQPVRVYTGTSKDVDFSSFKIPKNGVWFTTDPKSASSYAVENDSKGMRYNPDTRRYEHTNTASRVIPAWLRIENPATLSVEDRQKMYRATNYRKVQGEIFDKLRAQGHDGVDMGDGVWVVIGKPSQIKSAIGNRGTYSMQDSNMVRSAGGAAVAGAGAAGYNAQED